MSHYISASPLPRECWGVIDPAAHRTSCPRGTLLYSEGQPAPGLYWLCSGRVKITGHCQHGKSVLLRLVHSGEAFAVSAAVLNAPSASTAETLTRCEIALLPEAEFLRLQSASLSLAKWVAQQVSLELHSAWRQSQFLATAHGNLAKLAYLLLLFTDDLGRKAPGRSVVINMTQDEIAGAIGSSRVTVNRLLRQLAKQRVVDPIRGSVFLLDPPALRAICVTGLA